MGQVRDADASIFTVLIRQHRTVEALFDQIEALTVSGDRTAADLFELMRAKLLAHAKAEEHVVYPRFAQVAALAPRMGEARQEHADVEAILTEMATLETDHPAFLDRLHALVAEVQHHVQEEEGEIFPLARADIDGAEAEALAAAFQEEVFALTGERDEEAFPPPPAEGVSERPHGLFARLANLIRH